MNNFRFLISQSLCLLLAGITVCAEEAGKTERAWEFQLSSYFWLAGQEGSISTAPGLPDVDIDINSYDSVSDNVNGTIYFIGEYRRDKWGILGDLAYTSMRSEQSVPGPVYTLDKVRVKTWMVSAVGTYSMIKNERRFLDLYGGIRLWNVDTDMDLVDGVNPAPPTATVSNSETWGDPIVGMKASTQLGDSKFFIGGALTAGGFGIGSDFTGDAIGTFGYRGGKYVLGIGYRYLYVDYDQDGFLYDVAQYGFTIGYARKF